LVTVGEEIRAIVNVPKQLSICTLHLMKELHCLKIQKAVSILAAYNSVKYKYNITQYLDLLETNVSTI